MRYNRYSFISSVRNATRGIAAVAVLALLLVPFHAHALDYYHLAINHGNYKDAVYQWARNQLGVMGDQMQGHNPNSTFVNTGLSSWRDSGSYYNFLNSHMTRAAQNGQAFYMFKGGHGMTGQIGSGHYGGWGGVPVGRAQTLNYVNQRAQQLGIPAFVYDGSCGSALCVDAARHYLSNNPSKGLQGVISSGGSRGGYAGVTYIGPSRGPEASLAHMWHNFDALDQRHGNKGYLTLGEALPFLRDNASGYGPMSGIGAEGMDTPFFGKECFIGPPRDVCIVVAPGWAAKDEDGEVVHDSIPNDHDGYGNCIEDDSDSDEDADCPYRGEKTFTETRTESPNYDLYHGEQEGSSAHRRTTLKRLVNMAEEDYEHLWKQRYGDRNWEEVDITLVVPNKGQASEYVDSGFERYKVSGVSVKPGHYVVGRGTNIHPNAAQGEDNWEGVRANVSNGECTFETAEKPPPAPSPDPMGEGPGGDGGPGGGNNEDALLSMLGDLLGSLMGQDQEPEQEGPPEQDPDQDLSEVDEIPDYIVGCPEEFEPICAIDGRTYFNECVAQMEEKPIAHKGFCGSPIPEEAVMQDIPPSLMQQILNAVWSFVQESGVKEEIDVE